MVPGLANGPLRQLVPRLETSSVRAPFFYAAGGGTYLLGETGMVHAIQAIAIGDADRDHSIQIDRRLLLQVAVGPNNFIVQSSRLPHFAIFICWA